MAENELKNVPHPLQRVVQWGSVGDRNGGEVWKKPLPILPGEEVAFTCAKPTPPLVLANLPCLAVFGANQVVALAVEHAQEPAGGLAALAAVAD